MILSCSPGLRFANLYYLLVEFNTVQKAVKNKDSRVSTLVNLSPAVPVKISLAFSLPFLFCLPNQQECKRDVYDDSIRKVIFLFPDHKPSLKMSLLFSSLPYKTNHCKQTKKANLILGPIL